MADGSWSFFEEDEVCRKTADGSFMYGFVVKNSTYQSSDEEEDDEDRLEKGKVRVSWHPSGKESVVSENQVWNVDTLKFIAYINWRGNYEPLVPLAL